MSGNHPARLWTWGWGAEFRDPQREGEMREKSRPGSQRLCPKEPFGVTPTLRHCSQRPSWGPPPTSLHAQCPDTISRKKESLSQRTREGTAAQAPVGLFIAVEQQLPNERRRPAPAGDQAVTWMPNAAQAFVGVGGTARRPCCPHSPHLGHTPTPPMP